MTSDAVTDRDRSLPGAVVIAFEGLAAMQRGSPEDAMLRVQDALGGGVLSVAIEHVGDLIHRMTERVRHGSAGYAYVRDKVEKVLRHLTSDHGFAREHWENVRNNARARDVDIDEFYGELRARLREYALAHATLPVYNVAQWTAREAAVALGHERFGVAASHLLRLKNELADERAWWNAATKHAIDASGRLTLYETIGSKRSRDRLRSFVRVVLLSEGRVEDLQVRFPDLDVGAVAQRDPSSTKKHLAWMLKQLSAGAKEEDLFPTVEFFAANVAKFAKKDVNQYRDLKELEDAAKEVGERLSGRQQRAALKGNAVKLFEDDGVLLVRPDDKGACVAYGKGTKWCITMAGASYYEQYVGANAVFHFLIRKVPLGDDLDKVAVATVRDARNRVKGVEFYDAADGKISRADAERAFSKGLVDLAMADAAKRPKSLLAKLKSGDHVPADELVGHWRSLGGDRVAKIGVLAMMAEKSTWREKYADTLLSIERDPSLRGVFERRAEIEGSKIVWRDERGLLHREDGPAIEFADGSREWYVRDLLHREDGPAAERADGTRVWYVHGQLHREDGSAVEHTDGTRTWYVRDLLHREDGPAAERADGTRAWYVRGRLHRDDGPAVEWADGSREWWIRGQRFESEEAWKRALTRTKER